MPHPLAPQLSQLPGPALQAQQAPHAPHAHPTGITFEHKLLIATLIVAAVSALIWVLVLPS